MFKEQKIRAFLFYVSVFIFFSGLPFILSFALGYKFDRRSFKFTKTGLIVLKTQPNGASIFLDGNLLNDKTPANLNELLPGQYNIKLELEGHYPYLSQVNLEAGKVVKLEKVILFPLRPYVKKVNKEIISAFWVDESKGLVYYVDEAENSIFKSDMEGEHFERVSSYLPVSPAPLKWKFSPDREKLFYFNQHQICVVSLSADKASSPEEKQAFIVNYTSGNITDVFWHSDSFHLIIVNGVKVEIIEVEENPTAVVLTNLNKKETASFYDLRTDTLYFLDSQKAADGKFYNNLYKLELNAKLFSFKELMKLAPSFEKLEKQKDE